MPVATWPFHKFWYDNPKCLQTLPNVPWKQMSPTEKLLFSVKTLINVPSLNKCICLPFRMNSHHLASPFGYHIISTEMWEPNSIADSPTDISYPEECHTKSFHGAGTCFYILNKLVKGVYSDPSLMAQVV